MFSYCNFYFCLSTIISLCAQVACLCIDWEHIVIAALISCLLISVSGSSQSYCQFWTWRLWFLSSPKSNSSAWLDTRCKPHLQGGGHNLSSDFVFSWAALSLNCTHAVCSLGRDAHRQNSGIPLLSGSFPSEIPIFLANGCDCPDSVPWYCDFPAAHPTYHFACYQLTSSKNRELSLHNSPFVSVDFPSNFCFLSFSSVFK